jgi:hypothetical protein
MAGRQSHYTTDHDRIREWVEERGGKPTAVRGTSRRGTGILRIDFPGYSGAGKLEPISWDDFFDKFDDQNLVFLYQDRTSRGQKSNFNKLVRVSDEMLEENGGGEGDSGTRSRAGSRGRRSSARSSGGRTSGGSSSSRRSSAGSRGRTDEDDGRSSSRSRASGSRSGSRGSSGRSSGRSSDGENGRGSRGGAGTRGGARRAGGGSRGGSRAGSGGRSGRSR